MAILGAIPVIECQAIEVTLDFYLQLFQFVVISKRESKNCLRWLHLKHGDTTLMLKSIEAHRSEKNNSLHSGLSLYLYVNNIKELQHFIKAKNIIVSDVILMDYHMYEFKLLDPEGNMITVGQSVNQPLNK